MAGPGYHPPIEDIVGALQEVGIERLCSMSASSADIDAAAVDTIVREFARFAQSEIAPTDHVGDVEGAQYVAADASVVLPDSFADAYAKYVDAGWGAVSVPEAAGGGGYPVVVATALQEIFSSANLAFSLLPVLTQSATEVIDLWGTPEQRARYLPRLATGEWSGTMLLTEPEAGSDLSGVRTTAVPDDGIWRVTGNKIFITWGEHDISGNIVHVVLARTPGAAQGTRGLSLFLVPRLLANGERNRVRCLSLERKLGIHASPTCSMELDHAEAELLGEVGQGLTAMFTMMNSARLAIGVQGLGTGVRSYDQALDFARQRRQGRAPNASPPESSVIIEHPDVQRMLLDLRASTRAMRLLLYTASAQRDVAAAANEPDAVEVAQRAVGLLTPIAKAWCTDTGFRLASVAVQVHGGMGFIEDTGIAQRLRDSRIGSIYEGTNGIQAIDLVTRKVRDQDGLAVKELLAEIGETVAHARTNATLSDDVLDPLGDAASALSEATAWMLDPARGKADVLAGATPYLQAVGDLVAGWLLARQAANAVRTGSERAPELVADAAYFAVNVLPHAWALNRSATAGAQSLTTILGSRSA